MGTAKDQFERLGAIGVTGPYDEYRERGFKPVTDKSLADINRDNAAKFNDARYQVVVENGTVYVKDNETGSRSEFDSKQEAVEWVKSHNALNRQR